MVVANFNRTAPRLARVVGAVQRTPARAAIDARASRKVMIDAQQQREELRAVQKGMAHWEWSLILVEKRLSHSGRLFKVAEGDLLLSLAQLDQIAHQGHQHLCSCSAPPMQEEARGHVIDRNQ